MTIVIYTTFLVEVFGPFNDDNEADIWVETQQLVNGWKGKFYITSLTEPK